MVTFEKIREDYVYIIVLVVALVIIYVVEVAGLPFLGFISGLLIGYYFRRLLKVLGSVIIVWLLSYLPLVLVYASSNVELLNIVGSIAGLGASGIIAIFLLFNLLILIFAALTCYYFRRVFLGGGE